VRDEKAGVQFHDSHPEYSEHVLKTLELIADKLGVPEDKCLICKKTIDKRRPPYGLARRLDGVSGEHRNMIKNISPEAGKKFVQSGYFTSSRVE